MIWCFKILNLKYAYINNTANLNRPQIKYTILYKYMNKLFYLMKIVLAIFKSQYKYSLII